MHLTSHGCGARHTDWLEHVNVIRSLFTDHDLLPCMLQSGFGIQQHSSIIKLPI